MAEHRNAEAGVTLIEVLVVLTLIAVGAGVVTLALPDRTTDRSIAQEADLLISRVNLAAEHSLVEGRTFRMTWAAGDYGFSSWDAEGWQATGLAGLPATHRLDAGATLILLSDTREDAVLIGPNLLPPMGGSLEWRIAGGGSAAHLRFDGMRAALEVELMTLPARNSEAGFTLMETLVALAVLAAGSMALLTGVERHAANTRALEDRIVARWVAENALAAMRLGLEIDADWTRAMGVDWQISHETMRLRDTQLTAATVRVADREAGLDAALVALTGYVPTTGDAP